MYKINKRHYSIACVY